MSEENKDIEKDDALYRCNVKNPIDHCRNKCFCGMLPHTPNKCTKDEYCDIVGETVKCVKLTKKQLIAIGFKQK